MGEPSEACEQRAHGSMDDATATGREADALARITWRLEPHAGHWLPDADLSAVTSWMDDNGLVDATAQRSVIVRNGRISYGRDRSPSTVRAAQRKISRTIVPLRTPPPVVWQPTCSKAAMKRLQALFAAHEWSSGFDGVCVDCSAIGVDDAGVVWCHRDDAVTWPCEPVRQALRAIGCTHRTGAADDQRLRVLGDCLDPAANAAAFG